MKHIIYFIYKVFLAKSPKQKTKEITGCMIGNKFFKCTLGSGAACGLDCFSEHGEYTYNSLN